MTELVKRPCRYCGLMVLCLRLRPCCRHCAKELLAAGYKYV